MLLRSLLVATAFALVAVSGSAANAQYGCGYDWAYGVGVGGLYNGLDRYTDYRVPYFAAHPPVYYSQPVPRTYGYSPFAYPPQTMTPEISTHVAPVTITNPYVPASEKPASTDTSDETVSLPATSGPLVIMNPYAAPSTYAASNR